MLVPFVAHSTIKSCIMNSILNEMLSTTTTARTTQKKALTNFRLRPATKSKS